MLSHSPIGSSPAAIESSLAAVGCSDLAVGSSRVVVGPSAFVFDVYLVVAVNSHGAVSLTVFGAAQLVAEVGLSPAEVGHLPLLSGRSLLPVQLDAVLQLPIPAINHRLSTMVTYSTLF